MSAPQIDMQRIPRHIAIIMDGNGRWAVRRGLPRTAGHQEGVETVKRITEEAVRLGVKYLTLYTFSTENWKRPSNEVAALMSLVLTSLQEELFMRNGVRFRVIGDIRKLPLAVQKKLQQCERDTIGNTKMTLVVALSYSSRWEISAAARNIAADVKQGTLEISQIDEETFSKYLATAFRPDPELMIRTGGELRLSNYLLWQCAYSEFDFPEVLWPDFNKKRLIEAVERYNKRDRRFGGVKEE